MRSREYDLEFRERSARIRGWGTGLLLLATLLWGWCAVLLLTDDTVGTRTAEALAALVLSIPVALVGTALFTTGSVSRRMSAHSQAMRELDRLAVEREKEKRSEHS
ncbi:hypothetical protein CIB93_01325 [Streptomyces sp. WZ.A104]|uniref:hypothetical protein n=1 Tax=Streptomyces sp. WZ.A104 TaxID=2023771 RepID=UPI000BBC230F|nr:hypothetical protein [Streptomyces sp. WZ.A104]PCG87719.1 hypothetical protein CIB93_01325 [Streptomyces sp. WZ.A104]